MAPTLQNTRAHRNAALARSSSSTVRVVNVRYWPLADIGSTGEKMLRLQLLLFGITAASITTVQALPFSQPQIGLVMRVAAGCGLGVNRAQDYGCYPIYPPSYRTYDNPYYVGYYATYEPGYPWWYYNGPAVSRSACRGRWSQIE